MFELTGDYGHYRKVYSTTSPLTYTIPTRTSLTGLMAAIIGLDKDSYHTQMSPENIGVGVKILKPIEKTTINLNLIDTKTNMYLWDTPRESKRTQIPYEFLKNPGYCIYARLQHPELLGNLKAMLEERKSHYTPCMGLSECIAQIKYIGCHKGAEKEINGKTSVETVINTDKNNLVLEAGKRYGRERIPLHMNEERKVLEFGEIVYESNAKSLTVDSGTLVKVDGENITFL